MPSVRPKLVEEGAPIQGHGDDDDHDMDLFTNPPPPKDPKQQNRSSLSMSANALNFDASNSSIGMRNASSRSTAKSDRSSGGTQKQSSLARAAKGTLLPDKKTAAKKNAVQTTYTVGGGAAPPKKPAVQTSYVVGGGTSTPSNAGSTHIDFQDEKKSSDSPSGMMARKSVTQTSFQVPGNNNHHDNSFSSSGMDVDHHPPTPMATKFIVHPASSSQNPAYIVPTPATDMEHEHIDSHHSDNDHDAGGQVEKMEGVIDLSEKPPMVVLDGANMAYAYDGAASQNGGASSSLSDAASQKRAEPDARGIVVACNYFLAAGIRVLAVLPCTMMQREPHASILQKLQQQGLLVSAPSRDDDDAYAIIIARREDARAQERGEGPGYVMSNDMFRDAMKREEDERGEQSDLRSWLTEGSNSKLGQTGPGRISYTFCDMGTMDDHGDRVLDLVPNPRHPLIHFIEHSRIKST